MSQLDLWKKSWDPFREYGFGPKGLDRFFDDALKLRGPGGGLSMAFNPGVEMREAKDSYMMKFDLPGLTKDQIKIDFYENTLTVSGDRKEERTTEDKDAKVHYSEMSYGSFTRSFSFPQAVDVEKANAKFDNGVLTVEVPKRDGGNRRQIQVR